MQEGAEDSCGGSSAKRPPSSWKLLRAGISSGLLTSKVWAWATAKAKWMAVVGGTIAGLAMSGFVCLASMPILGTAAYGICSLTSVCSLDYLTEVDAAHFDEVDWKAQDLSLAMNEKDWKRLREKVEAARQKGERSFFADKSDMESWAQSVAEAQLNWVKTASFGEQRLNALKLSALVNTIEKGGDLSSVAVALRQLSEQEASLLSTKNIDKIKAGLAQGRRHQPNGADLLAALNPWALAFGVEDPKSATLKDSLELVFGIIGFVFAMLCMGMAAKASQWVKSAKSLVEANREEIERAMEREALARESKRDSLPSVRKKL